MKKQTQRFVHESVEGKFVRESVLTHIWMAKIRSKALIRIAADGCWRNKSDASVVLCSQVPGLGSEEQRRAEQS